MVMKHGFYDAVVLGGGFYGVTIAIHLARQYHFSVAIIEREDGLLKRASYNNQARIHNGYHYPRSFTTAFRSRLNLPNFIRDWPDAVRQDFRKLYAIARQNSQVTARQFVRFCNDIGAKIEPVDTDLKKLFDPYFIEDVFLAQEYAFDAKILATRAKRELHDCGVKVIFNRQAKEIKKNSQDVLQSELEVVIQNEVGDESFIKCRYLFNCTYSGLNQLRGDFPGIATDLKHEITEMALIEVPPLLKGLGITVMDGPFFSIMPFPARELHTLSHVRYTPHLHWVDSKDINPYNKLANYPSETRFDRMLRDTVRYLPAIGNAKYIESLFEVKTVLTKSEGDDSRPILFEKHARLANCYSVLGGKMDNIYDVLERLEHELV